MIHEDAIINDEDIVETSGYGEIFIENFAIGTVKKYKNELYVVPFADFSKLRFVAVIKKKNNHVEI